MTKTSGPDAPGRPAKGAELRDHILETAANLFYREGVRAVGVDLIVARAGVAKTSLYRYFASKDDLVEAFLRREDEDFWRHWDSVAAAHQGDPAAELEAHLEWIEERIRRPNYRGCPQLNVAAEFSDRRHPARAVAAAHKAELRQRVKRILERMGAARPDALAAQLALVINGAFVSGQFQEEEKPARLLSAMARALIEGMDREGGR
ncbi:TetR/AcrR family transcriptional regulator [Sphingosinicella sp. CPCC 101087]|uniref:TetR/AcrR family transcriptional regulator n=1 Tax=Sphingosinicella sp. CPCC 101087 TaxID=2497754 RepID=UPI00101C8696|nr:TetR/AcrR family transcriptional regulator [Sphingosinicella sp. CPCC 101087]